MTIKMVITGGCSFSDQYSLHTWPVILQQRVQSKYPEIEFRHTGLASQGQELIQKKISLALIEELERYKPEEILVLPMWSGTERKAFWIDNPNTVKNITAGWSKKGMSWNLQFHDLYSQRDTADLQDVNNTRYNPNGGWYHCNYESPDSKISKEFFDIHSTVIGFATISLENIIFLHNLCKLKGVLIYHSFYRSYVYNDIYENREHLNLKYLFKMLDHDNIISTIGMYEHLRPMRDDANAAYASHIFGRNAVVGDYSSTAQYFKSDNAHPNVLGINKWLEEVLIPKLNEKKLIKIVKKDVL
jgi:hypothetical protein